MEFLYEDDFPLFGGDFLLEDLGPLAEIPSSPQECDLKTRPAEASTPQPKTDLLQSILDQSGALDQPLQASWLDTKVDLLDFLESAGNDTNELTDTKLVLEPINEGKDTAMELLNSLGSDSSLSEVDSGLAEALSSLTDALGGDVTPMAELSRSLSPVSVEDVESLLSDTSPAPTTNTTPYESDNDSIDTFLSVHSESQQNSAGPTKNQVSKSRRKAPYGSTKKDYKTTDRKERKKQQNKDAALRYRSKKRSEQDILNSQVEELEEKNKGLHEKVDSISREIQYLKDLMSEVQKAKGKVN